MPASDFHGRVAARFAAAATSYDAHSSLQRHAAARLMEMLTPLCLPPRPRVCEIGCGTGHLTRLLTLHLPGARILASDIAPAMVVICRARLPRPDYVVMDGTQPAVAGPFDLVCANLAAQWFGDLPAALNRLAALLAPGGALALSLLGAATFNEWRNIHAQLGLSDGVQHFPDMTSCRAAFPSPGLLHLIAEKCIERHASALHFLRTLRRLGADTPASGHQPLSAAKLRRVLQELDARGSAITYEVLYALWRKPT